MAKKITKELYDEIISLFPEWKKLNSSIKKHYSRGVNFHEAFSEIIVGWEFKLLLEEAGASSADLISKEGVKYQVKGSSDYENDLSSFGPNTKFDVLYYCGLDTEQKKLKIWEIDIETVMNLKVNEKETFREVQMTGKRPRFSIYKKIIKPNNLKPIREVVLEK